MPQVSSPSHRFRRSLADLVLAEVLAVVLVCTTGLSALLVAFSLSACGPVLYVSQVTGEASSQVAAAKAASADKHAPYWYTLAVEYLHKAREEAAAADFQAANRFGRRSAEAARKARSLAVERARDPDKRPKIYDDDELDELDDPTSEEARADEGDDPLKSTTHTNDEPDEDETP